MRKTTKIVCVVFLLGTVTNKSATAMKKRFIFLQNPQFFQQHKMINKEKNIFNFYVEKIKELSKKPLKKQNARNILYAMEQLDSSKQLFFNELEIDNQESIVPLWIRKKIELINFYGTSEDNKNISGISQFKKKIQEFIQEIKCTNKQDIIYPIRVGEHMYLELRRIFYSIPDIAKIITPVICRLMNTPKFIKKLQKEFKKI